MLAIRLSRFGKKNHPVFRVIVNEKSRDTLGNYLELLGHYDPHTNTAELKAERIKYWISQGAQPSGTVHNLLVENKIIEGKKIKVANIKKKKQSEEEVKPAATDTAPEHEKNESATASDEKKPVEKDKPET